MYFTERRKIPVWKKRRTRFQMIFLTNRGWIICYGLAEVGGNVCEVKVIRNWKWMFLKYLKTSIKSDRAKTFEKKTTRFLAFPIEYRTKKKKKSFYRRSSRFSYDFYFLAILDGKKLSEWRFPCFWDLASFCEEDTSRKYWLCKHTVKMRIGWVRLIFLFFG